MKGYRITFIRHGFTQGNVDGKYIGTTDLPLAKEGAEQLYDIAEKSRLSLVSENLYLAAETLPANSVYLSAELLYGGNAAAARDGLRRI